MATFKTIVRYKRADGFYQVYIRVLHRSKSGYIKTDKFVTDKQLSKSGEIKDAVINKYCAQEILRYTELVNRKDVSGYSVTELIEYLMNSDMEVCFSDYATKFINRMASEGHERNAKNYRLAVNHLERYLGTTRVMFTHLSSSVLTRWINSLSLTNRAKEMYPTCLRQIFKRALIELNDEERGIVYCAQEILRYTELVNRKDVSGYSVTELIEYLMNSDMEVCFSDYATKFINRMASEGHERNAKNYRLAVNHLERYLGTTRVMFTHLSSSVLTRWINSLSLTNRAKEMYPTCLRQIFKRALIELNDEERGIMRIKYNPWLKVSIPKSDSTVQRAISAEACREFFNRPLPETKMISSLPELGRDVALLSLCLGGINTVDIFELTTVH